MENKVIAKDYVDKNFISRNEIREIIKELKYYIDNPKEAKHYIDWYLRKVNVLEELLENKILEDK